MTDIYQDARDRLVGPITAAQAIEYVLKDEQLDPFDALEFLDMWQHGEWDAIREEYPGAFDVAATDAAGTKWRVL